MKSFEIKWTVSRATNTYGYNICSLYQNKKKVTFCKGGGYDMKGTCLGDWLKINYEDRLKKLCSSDFYGLKFITVTNGKHISQKLYSPGCKVSLDGSCGWSSMESIAKAIGLEIVQTYSSPQAQTYSILEK